MPASRSPLDHIKIASPCTADWRFMLGNDLVRFCGQCNKNVYNLSAMTREQAETLIRRMEGRLCARYYMRRDGTILTADCPVGLRAFKQRVSRIATAIFAVLISFFANLGLLSLIGKGRSTLSPVVKCGVAEPSFEILGDMSAPILPPIIGKTIPSENLGEVAVTPRTVFRSESFLRDQATRRVEEEFSFSGAGYRERDSVVRVTISETGDVIGARYVSGLPELETFATDTAREWKFKPVKIGGLPVRVEGTLTFPVKTAKY